MSLEGENKILLHIAALYMRGQRIFSVEIFDKLTPTSGKNFPNDVPMLHWDF